MTPSNTTTPGTPPWDKTIAHKHCLNAARPFPKLHAVLSQHKPLSPLWSRNKFGLVRSLARAVVAQQISSAAANSITARINTLAKTQNLPLHLLFHPNHAEKLRACGLSSSKVRFLLAVGDAKRNGTLSSQKARLMNPDELKELLLPIPGIGPWTCDMLSIFWNRSPDVWPQGDLIVRTRFAALTGVPEKLAEKTSAPFSPFRSALSLHMWEHVRKMRKLQSVAPL